jgi:protease I
LHEKIAKFFLLNKVVGAICHGTVLVARSKSKDQKSVLYGRKTTALLSTQEMSAWALTCIWLKNYYRTYPESVESEVTRALQNASDFISGPWAFKRDSMENLQHGFVVEDDNYISSRWPGDVHCFALRVLKKVQEQQ